MGARKAGKGSNQYQDKPGSGLTPSRAAARDLAAAVDTDPPSRWPKTDTETRVWIPSDSGYMTGRADRKPYQYDVFLPAHIADADVDLTGEVAANVEAAALSVAALEADHPGIDVAAVTSPLLRSEAVASSRIEGLMASHRTVAEAGFAPAAAKATAIEISNNVAAMQAALDLAADGPVTPDLLCAVHHRLFVGTRDENLGGQIREVQNWIGGPSPHGPRGAMFVPPPPELVPELLDDLCEFANRDDLPAVAQAAVAHAQFETIHPFADGNGRTGRALVHVILRRRRLATGAVCPVSSALSANRDAYYAGLTSYRFDDEPQRWIDQFATATTVSATRARELADAVVTMRDRWLEDLGRVRSDSTLRQLVDELAVYPVLTAETVAARHNTSGVAARQALARLEAAGIVTVRPQRSGRGGTKVHIVGELFELLDQYEIDVSADMSGTRPHPRPRNTTSAA